MPSRWMVLLGLVILTGAVALLPPPGLVLRPEGAAIDDQEFRALEERLLTAVQTRDEDMLDRLLAEDYELVSVDAVGHPGRLTPVRDARGRSVRTEDMVVRRISTSMVTRGVARVTAELEWTVVTASARERRTVLVTDVWQFRSGSWRLVNRRASDRR